MTQKVETMSKLTPTQKAAARAAIVAQAKSQLGVEEHPRGSNGGNLVKQYLGYVGVHDPASWCMAFACWCVGMALTLRALHFADSTLTLTGYCPTQVDHARGQGTLVSAADAAANPHAVQAGDLMVENIPGEGGYHHTGVVIIAPDAQGSFETVEGNTNHSGASQGYAVMTQHRNIHDKASDGTAKYAFIITV